VARGGIPDFKMSKNGSELTDGSWGRGQTLLKIGAIWCDLVRISANWCNGAQRQVTAGREGCGRVANDCFEHEDTLAQGGVAGLLAEAAFY
jgi:hypothetical protein